MLRAKQPSHTNQLLDGLSAGERDRVLALCDFAELAAGQILTEAGKPISHVYFPTDSFISLVTVMAGGATLEVALVGNEGMIGVSLVLGGQLASVNATVQGAGPAWRMSAVRFRRVMRNSKELSEALNRYVTVRMSQLGQVAGCTRFHVVEQRLARWLLMTGDRAHSASFHMTHELLAFALGVRRVGVTRAATALQKGRLIEYSRGDIAILDRKGLERASCGCYGADLATYARILG